MQTSQHLIEHLVSRLELPTQRIIFIHARLKYLQQHSQQPYIALTQQLIQALNDIAQPVTILVPAYTIYGFMRSRLFHCRFSLSETGRFSEDIRQHIPCWRSPDPMYSVLDLHHYLPQFKLNYTATFAPDGLFAHLHQHNAIILNIDMPGFWATPIHRVEIKHQISYRRFQSWAGVMYTDDTHWQPVNYTAYLREVNPDYHAYPVYDQRKRLAFLQAQDQLHSQEYQGISLRWLDVQSFEAALSPALAADKNFLLADPSLQNTQQPWLT